MINHEALKAHIQAYAEASPQLRSIMEHNLMELLRVEAEFENKHQEFIAHTFYSVRSKDKGELK